MGDTSIAWTDKTWNPTRGCSRVNADCTECYAMKQAHRFSGPGKPYEGLTRIRRIAKSRDDLGYVSERKSVVDWSGVVRLVPSMMDQPLRWRKPRRVFVDSMSDLFHPALKFEEIAAVFGVMAAAQRHTFQVLTKRPARMLEFFEWAASDLASRYRPAPSGNEIAWGCSLEAAHYLDGSIDEALGRQFPHGSNWPLLNVWLGVSAGHQAALDEFVPLLLKVPAAVRFLSLEPQTEELTLRKEWLSDEARCVPGCEESFTGGLICPGHTVNRIDWAISGGESGPGARPFDLAWARKTRDQCRAAGVPYFLKQLGSRPGSHPFDLAGGRPVFMARPQYDRGGKDPSEWPADLRVQEFPCAL